MPADLNNINWDEFFSKQEEKLALVHKERENFELAKNDRPKSKEDILRSVFLPDNQAKSNKMVNLQNNFVGNNMTGPIPDKMQGLKNDLIAFNQYMSSPDAQKTDPFKLAKGFDYNGTQYGQFFDRYYHHPKFKKLGYSPFRDNEATYNANATWADDFGRMMKMWPKLAWDGYTGLFQNWGNYSLNGDQHHAQQMEKYMGIAQSSKGGSGAFITNLAGNSAYTFGILGEIATEELVLLGIGAIPGLQGIAGAGTVKNTLRFPKLIKDFVGGMKKINTLKKITQSLNNVNAAKNFWNGASKFGKGTLNFINPLEHTADFVKGYNTIEDLQKTSRGFGAFYRDLRGINAAWDEATLEGGMVQNEMSTKLLNEYYEKNGRLPEAGSEDAQKIYDISQLAGRTTSAWNIPAILYSNKIVFDKALRGTVLNAHDLSSNLTKTIRKVVGKDGKVAFEAFKKDIKSTVVSMGTKQYWKQAPRSVLNSSGKYVSANITEGFQEVYQEGLAVGAKDYYERLYKNPMFGNNELFKHGLYAGLQSQLSHQGLEVFLSGALMGSLVQGPQKLVFQTVPKGIEQLGTSEKLFGAKGTKRKELLEARKKANDDYADAVADSLTVVYNTPGDMFNLIYENAAEQRNINQLYEDALLDDDLKKGKDLSFRSLANHLNTLMSAGKLDIFKDKVKSMKELSDAELEEAFGIQGQDTKEGKNIRGRIDKVLRQIDQYKYNSDKFDQKFGKDPYAAKTAGSIAFQRAKRHFVYNAAAIEETADRISKLYNSISSNNSLSGLNINDIQLMLSSDKDFESQIKIDISAAQMMLSEESTEELKKEGKTKQNKINKLVELREKLKTISDIDAKIEKSENTPQTDNEAWEKLNEEFNKEKQELTALFKEYVKDNDTKSETIMDEDVNSVANEIVDFYRLGNSKKEFVGTVNILSNPAYFTKYIESLTDVIQEVYKNRKTFIKESVQSFQNIDHKNRHVFNALMDIGVFLTPRGVQDLENGRMPSFYKIPPQIGSMHEKDVENGFDELSPNANSKEDQDRFYKAFQIIRDYEDEFGVTLTGKKLFSKTKASAGYTDTSIRPDTDYRTAVDLYDELGLDPDAGEQTISVQDLLAVMSNSEFITYDTKELIKALQILLDKNQEIKIVRNSELPIMTVGITGIQLDLRYFGIDYGSNIHFERAVVTELIKSPLNKAYQDAEFKAQIDDMFTRVQEWFKDTSSEEKSTLLDNLGYSDQSLILGLTSPEMFISQAISNPRFQKVLQKIKSTKVGETKTTIFQKFLTFVKNVFLTIQGNFSSDTLLDEVVNLITERVFEPAGIQPLEEEEEYLDILNEEDIIMAIEGNTLAEEYPKLYDLLDKHVQGVTPKSTVSTDTKADIERRRQEELLGGFKVEDNRPVKNGSKPQTRIKVNSDGTKITFEGFYADKPDTGLNASYPKMTLEEFRNSEFYKNLKPESREQLEEMISDNEDSVTGIALNEIRISKSEGDFIGKGNSGITITILTKDGNINDIALASNTSKINTKYDAELAALENTKPVSDKKADIERRRQEDLEKINAQIERVEKRGDSNIRTKIEIYTTLGNSETLDEVVIITFKDGSRIFRSTDVKTGELVLDEKIKKENTTTNEQFIESWVGNLDNSLKKISEDNNPNKTAIDKINAKYDAELDALEGKDSPEVEAIISKLDSIEQIFIKKGTSKKKAEELALESLTEEEKQLLRDSYWKEFNARSTEQPIKIDTIDYIKNHPEDDVIDNIISDYIAAQAVIYDKNKLKQEEAKAKKKKFAKTLSPAQINYQLLRLGYPRRDLINTPTQTSPLTHEDRALIIANKIPYNQFAEMYNNAENKLVTELGYTQEELSTLTPIQVIDLYRQERVRAAREVFQPNDVQLAIYEHVITRLTTKSFKILPVDPTAEEVKYGVFEVNEAGEKISEPLGRISDLKPKDDKLKNIDASESQVRGTHIDDIAREFLSYNSQIDTKKDFINVAKQKLEERRNQPSDNLEAYKKIRFSDAFYTSLFDRLTTVRELFMQSGLMVITDLPRMSGVIGDRVTGECDILTIDKEGKLTLYDLKTAKTSRRANYKQNSYYKKGDVVQLNGYKELLYQSTGIVVDDLKVLPLTVTKSKGIFNDVVFDTDSNIDYQYLGDLTLNVSSKKDVYELTGRTNVLQKEAEEVVEQEQQEAVEFKKTRKARRKRERQKYATTKPGWTIQITPSIKAYFDQEDGKYVFIHKDGYKEEFVASQLIMYSKKLSSTNNAIPTWWDNITPAQQNIILESLKKVEAAGNIEHTISPEDALIDALYSRGTHIKFSRESFKINDLNPGETTYNFPDGANINSWTVEYNGTPIDTFATDELANMYIENGFAKSSDPLDLEKQIIEDILGIIENNPKGITKKRHQEALRSMGRSPKDEEYYNFISDYNLDPTYVAKFVETKYGVVNVLDLDEGYFTKSQSTKLRLSLNDLYHETEGNSYTQRARAKHQELMNLIADENLYVGGKGVPKVLPEELITEIQNAEITKVDPSISTDAKTANANIIDILKNNCTKL